MHPVPGAGRVGSPRPRYDARKVDIVSSVHVDPGFLPDLAADAGPHGVAAPTEADRLTFAQG
jgi:hypothetical protein